MALVPIVLGAGGKMTDWEGEPLKFVVEEEGGDGERGQQDEEGQQRRRQQQWHEGKSDKHEEHIFINLECLATYSNYDVILLF